MTTAIEFTDYDDGGAFGRLGELKFFVEVTEAEPDVNWPGSCEVTGVERSDGKPVSARTLVAMKKHARYWAYIEEKANDEASEYFVNAAAAYDDWREQQSRAYYGI